MKKAVALYIAAAFCAGLSVALFAIDCRAAGGAGAAAGGSAAAALNAERRRHVSDADVRDSGVALMLQCNIAVQDGRGPDSAACTGYLLGMVEGVIGSQPVAAPVLCFKNEAITSTQLALAFTTWAREHESSLGSPRRVAALEALRKRFPCQL